MYHSHVVRSLFSSGSCSRPFQARESDVTMLPGATLARGLVPTAVDLKQQNCTCSVRGRVDSQDDARALAVCACVCVYSHLAIALLGS